jgi:hypothetical protein
MTHCVRTLLVRVVMCSATVKLIHCDTMCTCAQHRDAFAKMLTDSETAVAPDDHGMTTIQRIRDGLATLFNYDKALLLDTEWVQLVQFVGADAPEQFQTDVKRLFEGLCTAIMNEESVSVNGGDSDSLTYDDIGAAAATAAGGVSTNAEALNLVCEDLVKMIQEEAKQPDGMCA